MKDAQVRSSASSSLESDVESGEASLEDYARAARRRARAHQQSDVAAAGQAAPAWTRVQLKEVQRELVRLGFHVMVVDGEWGPATAAGLVEAFGDDSAMNLSADEVIARLRVAKPPQG